jgi:type II secretory pathway component PulF
MKFTYIGTKKDGEKTRETVEAPDRFAVYDIARERGVSVTSVEEGEGQDGRWFNVERFNAMISRVSTDQLVLMTRNLSSMLKAGLPLSRGLSVIERQSQNPKLKLIVADLRGRIQKGEQFNAALAAHPRHFDQLYVSMVRSGEESGGLSDALGLLSMQIERSSTLRKKIRGAMTYPAIVLTIMCGIGIVMMVYVMPSITGTFKKMEVELPATTEILISASDFMASNTLATLGIFFGSIIGLVYFLRTRIGKRMFHYLILKMPIIGSMVKEVNAARTARTLSSLLTAGVDVMRALEITKDVVQNVYYKPVLVEARTAVEAGQPLSSVFKAHENLYPVFVGEMLMVGEETGEVGAMLNQLAVFYENEVERKTKDLSTIIEPFLMVTIGGVVGFFALAMIAPIYSLTDSIG